MGYIHYRTKYITNSHKHHHGIHTLSLTHPNAKQKCTIHTKPTFDALVPVAKVRSHRRTVCQH